ncbi:MAG: SUMF1/EgtB/PvdO family nonheme iron enzyme [Myxococcota bacterium]
MGSTLDGRYAIEQVLGEGPTGVVYAADDVLTNALVAVKVFHPALFTGPHMATNLLRLQRARAYVNDHVVRLRDVVVAGDRVYTVTDRMESPDLKRILVGRGPLLRREIPPIVEGIAAAMAWIHQIGVHGNLKPSNIFIDDAGATRVSDPWFLEGTSTIGPGELVSRSAEWVAPEQLDTGYAERKETDVYGLARIVARLLAGHALQSGASLEAQGVPVTEAVEAVLSHALDAQPEHRHATVSDFWLALQSAWDGDGMRAGATPGRPDRGRSGAGATAPYGAAAASASIAHLAASAAAQGVEAVDDTDSLDEAAAPGSPGAGAGSAAGAGAPDEIDDLGGIEIEEDAGTVVGSATESIPLDEILAMGLDPVLGERIEEVEALVLELDDDTQATAVGPALGVEVEADEVIELDGSDLLSSPSLKLSGADDEIIDLDDGDLIGDDEIEDAEIVFGGAVAADPVPTPRGGRPPATWGAGAEAEVVGGGASLASPPGAPTGLAGASAVAAVTERAASRPIITQSGAAPVSRPATGTSPPALRPTTRGSAVGAAESARGGTPLPGARAVQAPPERRNPMMIIAPLLLIAALALGWYVLKSARDRRQVVPATVSAPAKVSAPATVAAPGGAALSPAVPSAPTAIAPAAAPSAAAGQVAGAALGSEFGQAATDDPTLGIPAAAAAADASAGAAAGPDAGPADGPDAPAVGAPGGPDAATTALAAATDDEGEEEDDSGSEEAEPDVAQKSTGGKLPAGYVLDADSVNCPGGMARIKRKKDVQMADGTSVKAYLVWCIDRYEYPGSGSVPQVDVGLAQAKSLCAGRGRRLCTRSEWRGACGSKYPYGREYDPAACNTVAADFTPRALVAAGSKPGCKSGWGLYDMVGNAAEWTAEGYVNGGSSTKDGESGTCYRSARRTGGGAYVGFRCCADAEPAGRGSR